MYAAFGYSAITVSSTFHEKSASCSEPSPVNDESEEDCCRITIEGCS
jgi:hypothetical protein